VGPSLEMEVGEGRSNGCSSATVVPRWVATDVAMSGWCASVMLGSLEWTGWVVAGVSGSGDGV
jgi:hypothetical protein